MIKYWFIGNGNEAALVLQKLIENEVYPSLVITENYGSKALLPLLQSNKLQFKIIPSANELANVDWLRECGELPPLALVASFKKIPSEFLDKIKIGTFNIHPSYLPQYRGAAPIQWSIINKEKVTGVTLFKIASELDKGPIFRRLKSPIFPNDTYLTLTKRLFTLGTYLFLDLYFLIKTGNFDETKHLSPQENISNVKPAPKIPKNAYNIRISQLGDDAYYYLRALMPEAYLTLRSKNNKELKIKIYELSSEPKPPELNLQLGSIVSDEKNYLKIVAKNILINVHKVQREGKKVMDVKDFLNGFRNPTEWIAA